MDQDRQATPRPLPVDDSRDAIRPGHWQGPTAAPGGQNDYYHDKDLFARDPQIDAASTNNTFPGSQPLANFTHLHSSADDGDRPGMARPPGGPPPEAPPRRTRPPPAPIQAGWQSFSNLPPSQEALRTNINANISPQAPFPSPAQPQFSAQHAGFAPQFTLSQGPPFPLHSYGFAPASIPAYDHGMLAPHPYPSPSGLHNPSPPAAPRTFQPYGDPSRRGSGTLSPPLYQTGSPPGSPLGVAGVTPGAGHLQGPSPPQFYQAVSSGGYAYSMPAFAPPPSTFGPTFSPMQYQPAYSPVPRPPTEQETQGQAGWWYPPTSLPSPYGSQFTGLPFNESFPPPPHSAGLSSSADPRQQQLHLRPPFSPPASSQHSPRPPLPRVSPHSTRPAAPPSSSHHAGPSDSQRAQERRAYHPKAPQTRSDWVMWAGNVPVDATHDELWRLFASPASDEPGAEAGVSSLHLIARSNCAFVNFGSEAQLRAAIARFDGMPVRAGDPRCPRLVCRQRRGEDDLRAGVGGQRGTGVHQRWVREHAAPADGDVRPPMSPAAVAAAGVRNVSFSDDEPPTQEHGPGRTVPRHGSSGSDSYASTNSSLLSQHFPKRFFILKSFSQYDLDLSLQTGLWATQPHNEIVLDQAFRTSKEVYLFFSVNKSGEFFGYARMIGPIHGERRVSWASASTSGLDSPSSTRSSRRAVRAPDGSVAHYFFSPGENRGVENSPLPLSTGAPARDQQYLSTRHARLHTSTEPLNAVSPASSIAAETARADDPSSAPATMQGEITASRAAKASAGSASSAPEESLPPVALILAAAEAARPVDGFALDPKVPAQRVKHKSAPDAPDQPRSHSAHPAVVAIKEAETGRGKRFSAPLPAGETLLDAEDSDHAADDDGILRHDTLELENRVLQESSDGPSQTEPAASGSGAPSAPGAAPVSADASGGGAADPWGQSFKVEWIKTERLPFYRTRHIRNPWNQDREVKVSRDGTELEPTVGQQLIDEWEAPEPPSPAQRSPVADRRPPRRPVPTKSAPPSAQIVQMARGLPFERVSDLP